MKQLDQVIMTKKFFGKSIKRNQNIKKKMLGSQTDNKFLHIDQYQFFCCLTRKEIYKASTFRCYSESKLYFILFIYLFYLYILILCRIKPIYKPMKAFQANLPLLMQSTTL